MKDLRTPEMIDAYDNVVAGWEAIRARARREAFWRAVEGPERVLPRSVYWAVRNLARTRLRRSDR